MEPQGGSVRTYRFHSLDERSVDYDLLTFLQEMPQSLLPSTQPRAIMHTSVVLTPFKLFQIPLKLKNRNYACHSSWPALSGRLPRPPGELPAPLQGDWREVKSFAKTIKLLMDINILAFTSSEVCHLHVVIYAALTFFSRSLRLKI